MVVATGVVLNAEDTEKLSGDGGLAAALEKIGRLQAENAELRVSLAEVLARDAERAAEMEKLRADLAVLQRMLFGRSSEKSRPEPPTGDGGGDAGGGSDGGQDRGRGSGRNVKRGPGGCGRGGGITRTCRGLRCSRISRTAGTTARTAGSRSPPVGSLVRGAAGLASDRQGGGALPPSL